MQHLYKGRYLIAVYANNDEDLLGVFDNPKDMEDFLGTKYAREIIARYIQTFKTFPVIACNRYVFHFIDVYEEHDDVFAEEDKIFIEMIPKSKTQLMKEYCKKHRVSRKTYYRRLRQLGAEKNKDIVEN